MADGAGVSQITPQTDRLLEKAFEQNAIGVLSDERFSKMLQIYEKERKALAPDSVE